MQEIIINEPVGEWFALASAIITVGFGFICLLMPRLTFRILRLRTAEGVPQALSESRATMSGFYFGVGILAIAFSQPMLWLALGGIVVRSVAWFSLSVSVTWSQRKQTQSI